jgi:hypothetical protein
MLIFQKVSPESRASPYQKQEAISPAGATGQRIAGFLVHARPAAVNLPESRPEGRKEIVNRACRVAVACHGSVRAWRWRGVKPKRHSYIKACPSKDCSI